MKRFNLLKSLVYGFLLSFTLVLPCFAVTVIGPNTIIASDTTYISDTLDMTGGYFVVRNGAKLTIDKCTIIGTISPINPFLVQVVKGGLVLTESKLRVHTVGLAPNPSNGTRFFVFRIEDGTVRMSENTATVDSRYTVGLLVTSLLPTNGFAIDNNGITNFHGGFFLFHSHNAKIIENIFQNVSFGNVFNFDSNMNEITGNQLLFPGNFSFGNGILVINSDSVNVKKNIIESASCVGISVANSTNINIDQNKLNDGLTYAIVVGDILNPLKNDVMHQLKNDFMHKWMSENKIKFIQSSHIHVTNNLMAQNRFGLAAEGVDFMNVEGNIFIQRFPDNILRKFWTNNVNLLISVTNLIWANNAYKEAYTQINGGDNTDSLKVVTFPVTGGVTL